MTSDQSALDATTGSTPPSPLVGESTSTTVQALDEVVADVVRLGSYQDIPSADGLHLAISLSSRATLAIAELQGSGWSREQIVRRLERARAVHAESPFIRRLQDWPRGYQGDFESVEYLMRQQNQATPGRLSYWLEQYALDSALAQQHRNKADLQARAILETVLSSGSCSEEPRILVLAAGGSPDLRQIQSILTTMRFRAVLLDQDEDALTFSAERLPLIADRISLVRRNVVRGLQDVRSYGPFHLVLAGGLFDYLPNRVATMVLRYAREHLMAAGGQFMFTNIAHPNLYRPWMEHLGDWMLIHRTEADVRQLCVEAGFGDAAVSISRERTGLTLIVNCHSVHAERSGHVQTRDAVDGRALAVTA